MTRFLTGDVHVSVPASSANLGPGFDALGLALDLRDDVTAAVADELSIEVHGEGADTVSVDESHLIFRSMVLAFEQLGCAPPAVALRCRNVIPHGRGLGSSSAAIVAGVAAARGLVSGGALLMDDDAVFRLAAEIEGHPDNVAAALYGGLTVAYAGGDGFRAVRASLDPRIDVVVMIPPGSVETKVARGLLPEQVSHRAAAMNAGRAALLVTALGSHPELLLDATVDLLHQDYREPAMPESLALMRGLRDEGIAAVVSGAGPTVLAFCDPTTVDAVVERAPQGWETRRPALDRDGVRVTLPEPTP